jgi:hypothetical protein
VPRARREPIGHGATQALLYDPQIYQHYYKNTRIAPFSSFLPVGLATLYDPAGVARFSAAGYPVGYAGEESGLERILAEIGDFRVYPMELATAVQALRERKLTAAIHMPATPPDAAGPVKLTLYTIQNDIRATVVNVKLKEVFLACEAALRAIRPDLPDTRRGTDFLEFGYGLLVFMPAIIALRRRHRPDLRRVPAPDA